MKINGLWPRFDPTEAERALIVDRLSRLDMRWLDAAVESYRCETSSTVFRLAELLEHYRRIANTGVAREKSARGTTDLSAKAAADKELHDADAAEARRWLAELPRAVVGEAVKRLRHEGWIGSAQLPASIAEWKSNTALIVRARIEVDGTERGR